MGYTMKDFFRTTDELDAFILGLGVNYMASIRGDRLSVFHCQIITPQGDCAGKKLKEVIDLPAQEVVQEVVQNKKKHHRH
jgi:hypothetical protein